jgi:multisubunit Na+/H+ antiporter MnhB subunit
MTQDVQEPSAPAKRKISTTELIVAAICGIGVLIATWVALQAAGLPLFSRDAMEVVSDAWTRTATIGVIVAVSVTVLVGVFVLILTRATLGHDRGSDVVDANASDGPDR